MEKSAHLEQPDTVAIPTEPRDRGINIGDAYMTLDTSDVDKMIAKLERAIAAFKAEWGKK